MTVSLHGTFAATSTAIAPDNCLQRMQGDPRAQCWHDEFAALAALGPNAHLANSGPAHAAATRLPHAVDAEACATRGVAYLETLRGPFALALWVPTERRGLLAIDRFGFEPLYYTLREGRLYFATELDALLRLPGGTPDIDPNALHAYLRFHAVPSPLSIYRGIDKLQPGECLRFQQGRITRELYWRLRFDEQPAPVERLAEEFRERMQAAVRRSVASSGGTGAFLSGGTDSSTVSGFLSQATPQPSTYSVGFDVAGYDEMNYARIASRHFGTQPRELYVTADDVVAGVPKIAAAYDEPFGNASAVPAFQCARLAANDGLARVLAGDGGDEIFGGNARYAKQLMFENYHRIPAAARHGVIEPLLLRTGVGRLPVLRKGKSFIEQALVPLPDRLESYNLMNRQPLADVLLPEVLNGIDPEYPLRLMRSIHAAALTGNPLNRLLHLDLKFTLADNDLRKVTRTAELAGIDVRFPMLDEDLVDFSGRLPAALKVHRFQLRWFFKHALRDFLPPEILNKTKHGFGLPFGLWLREHPGLRELARDSLHGLRQRHLVCPDYIDRVLELHRTGHAAYFGVMIWVLMMLEQWLRARESARG